MAYKVEKDVFYKGLRCVVIFTDMGHRCGYVGIGPDHPLYGYGYSDQVPRVMRREVDRIMKKPAGKRGIFTLFCADLECPRIELLFDVHGSLTFSGGDPDYPVPAEKTWWFGFDCGHAGDARDAVSAEKYGFTVPGCFLRAFGNGVVRTKRYVMAESRRLADQLIKINKSRYFIAMRVIYYLKTARRKVHLVGLLLKLAGKKTMAAIERIGELPL